MKILVTGAAGFIGSHLVDTLVTTDYDIYGVDNLSGGFRKNINPQSKFSILDLRDREKTEKYIKKIKPEIIYHLAADATEGRSQFTPMSSVDCNLVAYLNILIPSIKYGLKKIILTSSMSIYGSQTPPFTEEMERKPDDVYGISKAAMEQITEVLSDVHKFKYTIFRPHNVYGPKQNMSDPYRNVIAIFINCLLNNKHFYIYGDGYQKRAFSYIYDIIPYLAQAGFNRKTDQQIINIGPTEEISINEVANIVLNIFYPNGIPTKLLPEYLSDRPKEVRLAWCTVTKAKKLLGYHTQTTLSTGIKKTIEWAKEEGPQKFHYLRKLELYSKDVPTLWRKKLL